MDIYQVCLNEIALEGLDGITLPALWLRLNQREEKISVKLTPTLQEILWKFLLQHSSLEFYRLTTERLDPVIFNRYLGINITSGKHVAIAPDELDSMQDIYYVKPVSNQPNIKGSCPEFETRLNVTNQLKSDNLSLGAAVERFGDQRLVIVASQSMREGVLRGPGVTSQTVESLTDIEYCILERIGRSRWQGEIQTVLNNYVFKQLKSAHIHYMMKSLFQKNLVTKQSYSYVREDKGGKVYQQILLHLPHFKTDARSVSDIRAETICEMLKQSENRSIACSDLRQIISVEGKVFRKLVNKMIAAGYVKTESMGTSKHSDKLMTLIKTPAEKQEEEILDDPIDDGSYYNGDSVGLVAELPLTLQGFRHIFSTGENGCSQAMLHKRLKGYGSLEARHLCRKVEKAKIVKIIMIDHGKQRTQKYIADNFARNSLHTKEFVKEKKKMQKIMEISDYTCHGEVSSINEVPEANVVDSSALDDNRVVDITDAADVSQEVDSTTLRNNSTTETETSELPTDSVATQQDDDTLDLDTSDLLMKKSKWDTHQTTRKMKRTNTILSFINEQKVVEGFFALQKVLQSEEKDEGLTTKVCKKTVKRLVQKLHNDALIKHFTVPITSNDCTNDVDFVMSLDCDSHRLKTAIEQAQFKKYSEDSKKIAAEQADVIDLTTPCLNFTAGLHSGMNLNDIVKIEDCKSNNKLQYGYQPKFLRNQIVHEYLWYLAYGHPYNGKEQVEMLDYDKVREYNQEKNWKRYLPPAPDHPDFGPGWLQVGDAAVLLPLSILCQFHQYPYKIDGLEQYVNDSSQKNTLVRHLPLRIRGLIFYKRKYLLSLIQVIENLCFMGLVTFNKQKKNVNIRTRKEFEMIYVHRNVSMLDTRKSDKGYSEVSDGIEYEKLRFRFNKFADVEQYWHKLRDICLMTPLGVRSGDESEPEPGARHTVKLKCFIAEHVARDELEPCDDGRIPGDNRGSAGLDSSLFAHLYRNWFRTVKLVKYADGESGERGVDDLSKERPRRLPKLVPTVMTLSEESAKRLRRKTKQGDSSSTKQSTRKRASSNNASLNSKKQKLNEAEDEADVIILDDGDTSNQDAIDLDYEVVTENNVGRNDRVKGGRGVKRSATIDINSLVKKKRRVKKNPPAPPKKKDKYPDLLDRQARKNMNGRFRVSFSSSEDEILLMCRIASTLISQTIKLKKQKLKPHNVVSGVAIRNVLWEHCKEAIDKTSVSCLRRIRILMKMSSPVICHDVHVAEILDDRNCLKELLKDVQDKDMLVSSEEVERLFLRVFAEVYKRFRNVRSSCDLILPDTLQELHRSYNTKVFTSNNEVKGSRVVKRVTSARDVTLSILENLIYVTLSLNEDEFSQYQAYNIFSNYSNELITEAWQHIKSSGIICKKPDMYLNRLRHLPFAVPVYHLSMSHFQSLQAGSMWKIFSELVTTVESMEQKKVFSCDKNTSSGTVIVLNLMLLNVIDSFDFHFPTYDRERSRADEDKSTDTNGNEASVADDDISDDDTTSLDKGTVTGNELYHLYRKKRFSIRFQDKSIIPVTMHITAESLYPKQDIMPDVYSTIDQLDSDKCLAPSPFISVEDDNEDDEQGKMVLSIIEANPQLKNPITRILSMIDEAGVLGIPLPEMKRLLHGDPDIPHPHIQASLEQLRKKRLIYVVGMWDERAISNKCTDKWFVTGTMFKGDRKVLRTEIRKELSGTNRFGNIKQKSEAIAFKWNQEVFDVYKNSISIGNSNSTESSLPRDGALSTSTATSDDVASTSTHSGCLISDASNYERVSFLCRPWHNVSGEVNHRTAKLLLTALFVHVLWQPGVTLQGLTQRFINIMQRIAIIELLDKLITCKCIVRQKATRHKPWQLFAPIENDAIASLTSSDDDHFRVSCDGMLRMTMLCRELDRLQIERNRNLSPFDDNKKDDA